ncbi:diguanylate cyclase domain-containing protein [Bradyrhizobium japonicum]|uniref:diguanylate cyclase domain-containing protein n=1 Tax=Bradyrhizobium japonicum TaxID=375 RepID=UPI000456F83F|nr:diguanylate cyclase [Bradyrhizobium japonicum]AHY54915.1 diguanylate cyclase domain-containing protein [Bradyrhizobium japonicum SEMIA 5079]MCD9111163.1 diguanylate cyclase [Bradyrhizobium japonicum]MCD9257330.1 diguanylate cyclase [Bradyrhizobium japonicum SEMIA 5079]MCD9824258.1 diguanylate cyclase [Bradyrhizobium japonicum]MCD9897083.1 diguanylate cyclase [Bradyrhizobium japonicum]
MVTNRELGKTRLPLWAGGFIVLICVAILGLSVWREWETHNADLRNAEIDVANLAHSLVQHADDTFELADTILVGLVHRLELDGTGPDTIAKLQTYLPTRKSSDRIRGIFVYDETGRWLATTEHVDFSRLNNSDREYFRQHRDSTAKDTLIGRPIKSRAGGQWIITASRRINRPDGSFAGVALLTIDVAYFAKFYERFDVGSNGSASLLNDAGIMLARSHDESSAFIGRDLSNTPLFREWKSRPAAAVYYFKSPLDGVQRLSYYQRSSRYPLMVLASKSQDDVLAPWRRAATVRTAFVLGLVVLIAVIGFYLVRQLWQRQRMAQALVANEAHFRLLAEQSSDMVSRIGLDNRLLYVSPSCVRIIGWSPEELLGTSAVAGIHADDMERVEQAIASLKNDEAEEARFVYRQRHRDKGDIWAEAALHVTRASDSGEVDGVVAVVRDMTEQKDLQDKLASLATTDGLTGLANRRAFDERLAEEWARARRDGTQISLLLIDVDHFKKFNDHYGHQAGDGCLRALGRILSAQAKRPADLAARYGGEEFAVLLPNTGPDGCAEVGEEIREALHDLAMLHTQNPPSRLVTASIGAATSLPSQTALDCNTLVAGADRALYAAKDSGRDRMVMSGQVVPWPAKSA